MPNGREVAAHLMLSAVIWIGMDDGVATDHVDPNVPGACLLRPATLDERAVDDALFAGNSPNQGNVLFPPLGESSSQLRHVLGAASKQTDPARPDVEAVHGNR